MASRAGLVKDLKRAAKAVREAQALIVTAGAGMGVDSGLPDFRGAEGLWRAYPPLKKLGLSLADVSNPSWFEKDPEFAWGFFGHRHHLYARTQPHNGFNILRKWGEKMKHGYFVFTSNVDGHFQKAGFDQDRVVECHGSINYLQCTDSDASDKIWPYPEDFQLYVDEETLRAKSPLPLGPPGVNICLARPNILMFGDWGWVGDRTNTQERRFEKFLLQFGLDKSSKFVVIEIGAGFYVPTVRQTSESLADWKGDRSTLIRINVREPQVPKEHISLPLGGLEALTGIQEVIDEET